MPLPFLLFDVFGKPQNVLRRVLRNHFLGFAIYHANQ